MSDGPYRRVWRLAWPMILSNLTVPLLGAVNTAVMGHLPDPAYLGAVALGAMVFNFLYWGFGFLRMSTTGFTAQALGAREPDEVRATLGRALGLGLGLGLCLVALQVPIALVTFGLLDAAADVEELAAVYLHIRIWSAPAALANYAMLGWFLGMQSPRLALIHQVFVNGLNIVLDLVFVIGLGWDVAGVAAATAIAEASGVVLALALVARRLRYVAGAWSWPRIADPARVAAMLRVNRDIFIRTLCLVLSFALFVAEGARLGTAVLAANAVLQNFLTFMAYGLDGFAHASEALVGRAQGAGDRAAFRAAVRAATVCAAAVAGVYFLVFAAVGGLLIRLLTDIPDIRELAFTYLPWAVATPLLGVWSFQLDGIFIGATRGREMRNAMIASLAVFLVALWTLPGIWGNHGLWASLMVMYVARALTLGVQYPGIERAVDQPAG